MDELNFQKMPSWKFYAIDIESKIDNWADAFEVSREAILRQLPIAYQWTIANPRKAPKRNIVRFLFSWMSKAQTMRTLTSKPLGVRFEEQIAPQEELLTFDDILKAKEAK